MIKTLVLMFAIFNLSGNLTARADDAAAPAATEGADQIVRKKDSASCPHCKEEKSKKAHKKHGHDKHPNDAHDEKAPQ